jgi:regulation of enolase protein 1 (concanavalin A-like superfamily)
MDYHGKSYLCNSDKVLLLRHPSLDNEQLLLGDVVISVETAARQAEERGHTLVDELRILLVNFSHLYPLFFCILCQTLSAKASSNLSQFGGIFCSPEQHTYKVAFIVFQVTRICHSL